MATILELILKGKDAGASAAVKGLDKALGGLSNILGGLGLGIGTAELIRFGQASIAAARESAAAEAELQAVLVSSGQATAEYKDQLEGLATALENTSLFTDEAVMHAQAVLLTFDKIGQETMPRATQAAADLAQLLGTDLQSASIQIGKALQGQISALARSGVSFTEEEKARAEALFATGRAAEAQGIILGALEKQVSGQAAAARDAAGGAQDWAVSIGRLQEAFGGLLLAMGDSGVGGAATGLMDTLAEGATIWTANVEQIQLFVDALNNVNETAVQTGNDVGVIQQIQKGWEIILLNTANAAIESTIGWDALAESYGEVKAEADAAARATAGAASAISTTPAKVNPAQRAVEAYAASIRDLTQAQQENLNAPQTGREADAYRQMAMGRVGMQDAALQAENEQNQRAADAKRAQEKEAAAESKRVFKESTQAMVEATSELGNQISSAVSGAISGVNQDVIGKLLGIEGAEANAGEAVRRMAAVAAGGIQDQWAPALAAQLTGVQDQTAQAFVQAFQAGDSGALQAAAGQLALNPIVELFDANLIAQQVEQKLRAQQLTQQLNDKVNALLGEKGLAAVTTVTQQVGQAATDTGTATGQVQQSATDMATSAEAAGAKMATSFDGVIAQLNIAIQRLQLAIGLTERWGEVAGQTAGRFNALNPPAVGGAALTPNGAQRRIGGVDYIE